MRVHRLLVETFNQVENQLAFCGFPDSDRLLIQVFSGVLRSTGIRDIQNALTQHYPSAAVVGCTTDGAISGGRIHDGESVLFVFTEFAEVDLNVCLLAHASDDHFATGRAIATKLMTPSTKVIITFSDGLLTNGKEYMRALTEECPGVVVSGGMAADAGNVQETFVFNKTETSNNGVVAVALNGAHLQLQTHYCFDWTPMGRHMRITKAEANRVYEIDGVPAKDIYAKYLGKQIAKKLPRGGISFPLIVERDGILVGGAVSEVADDGSLVMGGNIGQGDDVRFGVGNVDLILSNTTRGLVEEFTETHEALFVYSCMGRRRFLGDAIAAELMALEKIAPSAGFFTYGEFYSGDHENLLLTHTMTLLAMSEETSKQRGIIDLGRDLLVEAPKQDAMYAMAHLANRVTTELEAARESELFKNQRKLEEAHANLRNVLDQAGDALFVIDPKTGGYVDVNKRACLSLQYTRDELLALGTKEVGVTATAKDYAAYAVELGPEEILTRIGAQVRKDGSHLPVEVRISVAEILGETRILVVARDITERLKTEKTLQQSEERYRELFEQSPIPTIEVDWSEIKCALEEMQSAKGELKIVEWLTDHDVLRQLHKKIVRRGMSDSLLILYGVQTKEAFKKVLEARPERSDVIELFREAIIAFYNGASVYESEFEEIDSTGRPMTLQNRFFMPPENRHNWSRLLITLEDVTARKATEQALRNAQKMEAIGQLTGGVAHDFNNLLAVIQGCAELLEDMPGQDEELTGQILRTTDRGAALTRRLLAYARNQPLEPKAIDLRALVIGMQDLMARTLGGMVEVEVIAPTALWTARADPGQVEDTLLNLAINASHAMPGGGKLTIECENIKLEADHMSETPEVPVGEYVMIAVADTGIGMSPDVIERAFEPFYTTKGVGEGSGLGLSMVYGFAKQSGGHASIFSEEGKGTMVKVLLPRDSQGAERSSVASITDRPTGNGETVLVIEDDPSLRLLTEHTIKRLGYIPSTVEHAEAARALLAKGQSFDVILTDVMLPGGTSGTAFAHEVLAQHPQARILFMSGYPAEAASQSGFVVTNNVLLNKPFTRDELARALEGALRKA
ncbi:FIST N-terminal domain-containing protein [Parasedimentitalea maritima]|uniref:histidine kinase n=1 Tax=Parasedimentitalea maritima TaxID=2578117 RepID=A0A6A4RD87_9RHOB|nr:FIST N-terminal domain-containing protein [Zongyanglinia marina]KAE9626467.1 PAS domain S-box protein [Zongyanglinia marina]